MTINNNLITIRQFTILVFSVTVGDLVLNLASIIASESRQDAWLACIIGCALGLLLVLLYSTIAKRCGSTPFFTFTNQMLGRWLGTIFALCMLIFVLITVSGFVREVSVFMVIYMLPETPIQVTTLLLLLIIVIATRLGLEAFTRSAELFFGAFVFLFILFAISIIPSIHFDYYEPILGLGPKPLIRGIMQTTLLVFSELFVFLKIIPHVVSKQKLQVNFLIGATLGSIVLIILTYLCVIVLGVESTARHIYPVYALARKINVGNFLQRFELIFTVMWVFTTFIKITVYFYVFTTGLARLLRLKDYRTIVFPNAILLYVMTASLSPNTVFQSHVLSKYWFLFNFTFAVCLPLMLLAAIHLRKKLNPLSLPNTR